MVVEGEGIGDESEVVDALRGLLRDLAEVRVVDDLDRVQRRGHELVVLRLALSSKPHRFHAVPAPDRGRRELQARRGLVDALQPHFLLRTVAIHALLVPHVELAQPRILQVAPVDVRRKHAALPASHAHRRRRIVRQRRVRRDEMRSNHHRPERAYRRFPPRPPRFRPAP